MFQKNLKEKKMSFRFGIFSPLGNIRELFSFEVWDGIRKRGSRFLGIENVFFPPVRRKEAAEIHCLPVTSA